MLSRTLPITALLAFLAGPAWADGDAVKGALVFHNHCDFCHSAVADEGDGNGPNLAGIVGRKAGAKAGFEYSAAMKDSGITWSAETITQFVQDPDKMVPGTKMARKYKGVDTADIPDLVAYLQSKSPAPALAAAPAGTTPNP